MIRGVDFGPGVSLTPSSTAEAIIHDFFRNNSNYFHALEVAAETLRDEEACETDDIYAMLKARLSNAHGIAVRRRAAEDMTQALRVYDRDERVIHLSEALDHCNQVFQLAHVLCLVELQDLPYRPLTRGDLPAEGAGA